MLPLARGLRFGFVASSDNHRSYPGAYGEGVIGLWAEELTSRALFEAMRARRTYVATGDRIRLEVKLNDRPMGSELRATDQRQIDARVEGQDSIAMVELLRNNRVIQRYFPEDHPEALKLPGRAKCRIQYGWGPWADLSMGRVFAWDMTVRLDGGRFLLVLPCFQSTPFGEELRDKLRVVSEREIHLQSPTTREQAFAENPTKALVCELEGGPDAVLSVELRQPVNQVARARLAELITDNMVTFTGVFTSESYIIHRLVAPSEYSAAIRWHDHRRTKETERRVKWVTNSLAAAGFRSIRDDSTLRLLKRKCGSTFCCESLSCVSTCARCAMGVQVDLPLDQFRDRKREQTEGEDIERRIRRCCRRRWRCRHRQSPARRPRQRHCGRCSCG